MCDVCAPTDVDVKRQFGACRDEVSDCTPTEAAGWIRRVVQKAGKGIGSWPKYWLTATANHPGFKEWCAEERGFGERKPAKKESYFERKTRELVAERQQTEAANG